MFGKIKRQARFWKLHVVDGNGPDYQLPIIYCCQAKVSKCARILFSTSFSTFFTRNCCPASFQKEQSAGSCRPQSAGRGTFGPASTACLGCRVPTLLLLRPLLQARSVQVEKGCALGECADSKLSSSDELVV